MIKYPAAYARMRGLKGKLLGKGQLESFLSASDTQTIITALHRTVYGEQIRGSLDLSRIEHGLKQELAVSHARILTFLRGRPAGFVGALLGKFELLNLKSILRSFVRTSDAGDSVAPFIFHLGKYHTIPIEEALGADDLASCIALLRKTPFARPLEIGYQQYEATGKLFPLELALDLDYYGRLWRSLDALGPMDKRGAGRLLGARYDIINLLWVLRFKEYHSLSREQIFQYIIPHGWKIHVDLLSDAAAVNDIVGTIVDRRVSPYDGLLKSVIQLNGSFILGVELCLLRFLYRESLGTFVKFPLQAAQLIAFLNCKGMQIRDIITILAGRHLGLSEERIRSYMVTL